MPNVIDDFVPWRILQSVVSTLGDVSKAAGYNTDPTIYQDLDQFEASAEEWQLMVEADSTFMRQQGAGRDHKTQPTLRVIITGVAQYGTELPRMRAMMLEQDVRAALHGAVKDGDLRADIGRGGSMQFSDTLYDAGALAPDKEAGFKMLVNFTWSQGSGW